MTPIGRGAAKTGITVVIADDQPEIRRVLRRVMEKDGRFSIVGEATDGHQAIVLVATEHPDVVILDLAMPNTNGMQAIPELVMASPETKIVVFSSMAPFNDTESQAMGLGAALVLSKYTPPRKLLKALIGLVRAP
jgi:DNA-binding NarL/FixJ family response regulator